MAEKKEVSNYLVFAILSTICCCMPLGLPAIYFSGKVNGFVAAGDMAGAEAASKNAKTWCWVAFGCGLAAQLLVWLFYGAVFIAALHSASLQH